MTEQKLMEYCQSKLGAVLEYPFDPVTAVFKTGDKIFALIYEDSGIVKISLKCEPMLAEFLRQQYQSVTPGWHLNKTHWNTVLCDGGVPDDEIFRQIDGVIYDTNIHAVPPSLKHRRFFPCSYRPYFPLRP